MNGVFSYDTLRELQRKVDEVAIPQPSILRPDPMTFAGMRITESPAFPHEFECEACEGSGEGASSTYCERCSGAGRIRVEGMVQDGRKTILFTGSMPKTFSPRFPDGLVPAPRLSRGLP